jgi:hypothetical protein
MGSFENEGLNFGLNNEGRRNILRSREKTYISDNKNNHYALKFTEAIHPRFPSKFFLVSSLLYKNRLTWRKILSKYF